MAKKKTGRQSQDKQFHKENYKKYTKATVYAINQYIEDVELDDLIEGIFLHTNDEDVNYLLKLIEKQLLLCKIDFERFSKELHSYYLAISSEIKDKNLYKKFYKLTYYIVIAMEEKNINKDIINAYLNFIMQLNAYLPQNSTKSAYGVNSKGKLLIRDEITKNLGKINHEFTQYKSYSKSAAEINAIYHKYGYPWVKDMHDMMVIATNDQIITNMLFYMAYLINENNEHMVAMPYMRPNKPINFIEEVRNKDISQTLTKLSSRELLLPAEGILVSFGDSSSLKEVFMEETIIDGSIILLYRIKMDETNLSGFFDTRREMFFSPWKDTDLEDSNHKPLRFLILQMYMYLTCVLTKEERESFYILHPFDVRYHIKVMSGTLKKQKETYEPYDRSRYLAELIDIKPFLRHLPVGATASDDAHAMARKLGIELPKGMTLVRGFRRKSWVKDGESYTVDKE